METGRMHQVDTEMCQALTKARTHLQTRQKASVHTEIPRKHEVYLLEQGDAMKLSREVVWAC